MIECPICHVNNEDSALFCAECGQRFGPPANQGPPQPTISEPVRSRPKLHSPILGGADADDSEPPSQDFGRLRGTGGRKAAPQEGSGKHKGLRSPLLQGDDEDDFDEPAPAPRGPRGAKPAKGGLRSPLLRSDDDEDDFDDDAPRGRGGGFPHLKKGRPQPEPQMDDDEPQEGAGQRKGGLRSPLLGGADEGDDVQYSRLRRGNKPAGSFPGEERRSNPDAWDPGAGEGGGRPKLRSKLLGGGGPSYDEDLEDEDEDYDDPNMLRSPLLRAAKRPDAPEPAGSGRPQPPHGGPPQPNQYQGPQAPPQPNQYQSGPQAPPQPYPGGPPQPGGWNQQQQGGWNQGPQPAWNESTQNQIQNPNNPSNPNNHWNQNPMGGPGPSPMGAPIPGLSGPVPPGAPGWQTQTHTGNYGARPDPDPTPSKDFPAVKPPEPAAAPVTAPSSDPAEAPARPKPQVRSRLLAGGGGDEEPDDAAPSFDRFSRSAQPAPPRVPMALMFGVVFALIGKLWYMAMFMQSFTNSVPMLLDQVGQIVVMVILIIMIMSLSKGSN